MGVTAPSNREFFSTELIPAKYFGSFSTISLEKKPLTEVILPEFKYDESF
jgi:hypothetical protein